MHRHAVLTVWSNTTKTWPFEEFFTLSCSSAFPSSLTEHSLAFIIFSLLPLAPCSSSLWRDSPMSFKVVSVKLLATQEGTNRCPLLFFPYCRLISVLRLLYFFLSFFFYWHALFFSFFILPFVQFVSLLIFTFCLLPFILNHVTDPFKSFYLFHILSCYNHKRWWEHKWTNSILMTEEHSRLWSGIKCFLIC